MGFDDRSIITNCNNRIIASYENDLTPSISEESEVFDTAMDLDQIFASSEFDFSVDLQINTHEISQLDEYCNTNDSNQKNTLTDISNYLKENQNVKQLLDLTETEARGFDPQNSEEEQVSFIRQDNLQSNLVLMRSANNVNDLNSFIDLKIDKIKNILTNELKNIYFVSDDSPLAENQEFIQEVINKCLNEELVDFQRVFDEAVNQFMERNELYFLSPTDEKIPLSPERKREIVKALSKDLYAVLYFQRYGTELKEKEDHENESSLSIQSNQNWKRLEHEVERAFIGLEQGNYNRELVHSLYKIASEASFLLNKSGNELNENAKNILAKCMELRDHIIAKIILREQKKRDIEQQEVVKTCVIKDELESERI